MTDPLEIIEAALADAHDLGMTDAPPKIVTSFVFPPIPIRTFDWLAWYDGEEEVQKYGHGKTEQAAIDDLLCNFPRRS